MSDIMLGSTRPQTSIRSGPVRFSRLAGLAGLLAVAFGFVQVAFAGTTPGVGDCAAKVTAYFADNGDGHRVGVVILRYRRSPSRCSSAVNTARSSQQTG